MEKENIYLLFRADCFNLEEREGRGEGFVPAVRFSPHLLLDMFPYKVLYKYQNQVNQGPRTTRQPFPYKILYKNEGV